ncbi:molybdopterin synthase [Natrialbaceae archaeon A-arb3/5]
MHVVGIYSRGADENSLEQVVDRTIGCLERAGRVGVIRYDATIADGTHVKSPIVGGDVTYDLGADGDWTANGTGMSVGDALDRLAVDCEYAVVVGVPTLRYPSIAVGSDAEQTDDPHLVTAVESATELAEHDVQAAVENAEPHETLESLVHRVKQSPKADRSGAIATFTGRVRAKDDADDARTEYLEFEKYEGVADQRMADLEVDLETRDGVLSVELYHRTGVVEDGEDIVFVVVLAGHREEAFRTVEDGINRLKDEVPLFKKEVTVEDEFWVHDRS